MVSEEAAHGHNTSGFKPRVWNAATNWSQDDKDPWRLNLNRYYQYIKLLKHKRQKNALLTGISAIGHNKHAQRRQANFAVVLAGQQAPVQVTWLDQRHRRLVLCHHQHPRRRIEFHQRVRHEDHLHAVEDTLMFLKGYFVELFWNDFCLTPEGNWVRYNIVTRWKFNERILGTLTLIWRVKLTAIILCQRPISRLKSTTQTIVSPGIFGEIILQIKNMEIQITRTVHTFMIITGSGKRFTMCKHVSTRNTDTLDTSVFIRCVLEKYNSIFTIVFKLQIIYTFTVNNSEKQQFNENTMHNHCMYIKHLNVGDSLLV